MAVIVTGRHSSSLQHVNPETYQQMIMTARRETEQAMQLLTPDARVYAANQLEQLNNYYTHERLEQHRATYYGNRYSGWNDNDVTVCRTVEDVYGANLATKNYIAAYPRLRRYVEDGYYQGWDDNPLIKQDELDERYMEATSGVYMGGEVIRHYYFQGMRNLDFYEKVNIYDTYKLVDIMIDEELDPCT